MCYSFFSSRYCSFFYKGYNTCALSGVYGLLIIYPGYERQPLPCSSGQERFPHPVCNQGSPHWCSLQIQLRVLRLFATIMSRCFLQACPWNYRLRSSRLHGKSAQKLIWLLCLSQIFQNVFRPFHLNEKTVTLFLHLLIADHAAAGNQQPLPP